MDVEDRLAILDAIAQYSYTYDSLDADGYAKVFTEDAVFEMFFSGAKTPEIRLESRESIYQWAANRLKGREGIMNSRHHQSGTIFDIQTPDSAETRTMVLVTHQEMNDATPHLTLSGEYHDHWRKTSEGWKIIRRVLYSDKILSRLDGV